VAQVLVSVGTGLELLGLFLVSPRITSWLATRARIERYRQELAFYSLVAAEAMVSRGPFVYRGRSTKRDPMAAARLVEDFGKASKEQMRVILLLLPRWGLLLTLVVPLIASVVTQVPLWIGLVTSYGLYTLAGSKWGIEAAREAVVEKHHSVIIVAIGFLALPIAPLVLLPFELHWVAVVTVSLVLSKLCSYLAAPDSTSKVLAAAGFMACATGVGLQLWASLLNS